MLLWPGYPAWPPKAREESMRISSKVTPVVWPETETSVAESPHPAMPVARIMRKRPAAVHAATPAALDLYLL
jgi:hypothetical protein